jgi:hypothetical protein
MSNLLEVMCPDFQLRTGCNHQKAPGDLVMIGCNLGPLYEIVHVAGPKAWVRPLQGGVDGIADVENLRFCESIPEPATWFNREARAAA